MASPTSALPTRSATTATNRTNSTLDDDAIPDEDSGETSQLFHERLNAWRHAVKNMEAYIEATEKMHHDNSKDYAKVLKTVSSPLKEGHHFDQSLGGIAGMFDNVRSNTQALENSHSETAKTLKGTVLPIFDRLEKEIKNKTKELTKGAGKGAKSVDKARGASQKHIELLGQHTATYDSSGGNVKAGDDPYILQRQIYHRLNKQVIEENNNREDMLTVQNSFAQFEAHVITTVQHGWQQFNQVVTHQTDTTRSLYGDMTGTIQRIPQDFEWNGFVKRNVNILIDPNSPKRAVENIKFANADHASTRPLIAGSLERKSGLLKKYDAGFYVVTPSKYLHEFKTDDDFAKDPSPENSLYLPDCMIGGVDGVKFNVRGKDASGNAMLNKMSRAHEFAFKAHTPDDARKWHSIIASVAGQTSNELPGNDESPVGTPIAGQSETVEQVPQQTAAPVSQSAVPEPTTTTAPPAGVAPQSTV